MSLDSDVIVDRRRIRRKLTFWRVVAALLAIAAVIIIGSIAGKVFSPSSKGSCCCFCPFGNKCYLDATDSRM